MGYTNQGLPNGGQTQHYNFEYDEDFLDPSKAPADLEPGRTAALMAKAEEDFALMQSWFPQVDWPSSWRGHVRVANTGGGAKWSQWISGPNVELMPMSEAFNGEVDYLRYLLVAEMVEVFMGVGDLPWTPDSDDTEGNMGEALSRFLSSQFLIANKLDGDFDKYPRGGVAPLWLESSRADYVNYSSDDNQPDAEIGCGTLFLYYLHTQLGFSIQEITANGAPTLAGAYQQLTGDPGDPFPFFARLIASAFPAGAKATAFSGPNPDDPFPIAMVSFWADKNTFGRSETQDLIASANPGWQPSQGPAAHAGVVRSAFWLVLEGFNRQTIDAKSIPDILTMGGVPELPGMTLSQQKVEFESANQRMPQRVMIPFDVHFQSLAAFPSSGVVDKFLHVTVIGGPLPNPMGAGIFIELTANADPYFTNIDPKRLNSYTLSQDLRVFNAVPKFASLPGGPTFDTDSVTGAYFYLQELLKHLNDPENGFTGTKSDPFAVIKAQGFDPLSEFSMLYEKSLLGNVYNFAIARVRLRGTTNPPTVAKDVKVFFRVWQAASADSDFKASTYPSHVVNGLPEYPLAAKGGRTVPFFATSNSPSLDAPDNPEYGKTGVNKRTIALDAKTGDATWAYFGCFLNFFDPGFVVDGKPVLEVLKGSHHCLVAQIAYDGAPIVPEPSYSISPENSDKLAQRNLVVAYSDNPGPAAGHRVPQVFVVRPSPPPTIGAGGLTSPPDELMIEWGATPAGAVGHLFLPRASASKVLDLAKNLYGSHLLYASDAHTISFDAVKGVTFVPIPPGKPTDYAGLLTVDLPPTVKVGQELAIAVRRLTTGTRSGPARPGDRPPPTLTWRYVAGTFHVKIPVSTGEAILAAEENLLALFKWRLARTAPSDPWHPVLARYVEQVEARVAAFGGDPRRVPASPTGVPARPPEPCRDVVEHSGKVARVLFDCFGEVEGFELSDCCAPHVFKTREPAIAALALRACKERLTVCVFVAAADRERIVKLAVVA